MSENKTYMIKGKAYYFGREPRVSKEYPDKGAQWTLTLTDISSKDLESLRENLKTHRVKKLIRDDMEKGDLAGKTCFTFDRRAFSDEDGKVQNYPVVVDKYNEPIPRDTFIGNGSDVIVEYRFRPYKDQTGKDRHTAQLLGVQVVNLVRYEPTKSNFTALESKEEAEENETTNHRRSDDSNHEELPF